MTKKPHTDELSGTETTGHDWDGVRELNNPLPKWWLYVFYACVIWALGLVLLYPSIPGISGYFHGILGYSSRVNAMAGVREMHQRHAAEMDKIASMPIADVAADPNLTSIAMIAGRSAFADNCQPCHGANGTGRIGYPALGDDVWLWGGTLRQIETTITHGARNSDPESHQSQMPSFGDGMLKPAQIGQVADYVGKWWGFTDDAADTSAGAKIFADNCAVCHGDKGLGNRDVGAPPLASRIHLYNDGRDAVIAQVTHPRHGVMPNWGARLDPGTIKSLAIYVHALGGGE
jgi:cytochrome c oxidase cbb3-type subunit 3